MAAESIETRCLLSATNPSLETVWPEDCVVEHDIDPAINHWDYTFDTTLPPGGYAFDLTFDEAAFLETVPEWDTSQSWFETDFWLDNYEEIRDSFQAAIDGTFNGFIDSLWYEDGQTVEYIGDVIYLTLESASGMLLPVEVFVSGGTAENVLASGTEILQQVEQMLIAPENNLFDTSSDLQVFDVSVNLFQFNDGTSNQLVIDSYEIFREDLSSPGFFESEFVIVDDFSFGTETIVQDPFFETVGAVGENDLLALADLPVDAEVVETTLDEPGTALEESTVTVIETVDGVVEPDVEFSEILETVEPTLEQATSPESDIATESASENGRSEFAADPPQPTVSNRFKLNRHERQTVEESPSRTDSTPEQAVAPDSQQQNHTAEVPDREVDRWQQLRKQAAIAARQIAAAGSASHLSAFQRTGVIPATTGSIGMDWGATIAAFAHSALEDQLQGLTAEADNEPAEDSTPQMTYAQAASATGTIMIAVTAASHAIYKRRKNKLQQRQATATSIANSDTRYNFGSTNA